MPTTKINIIFRACDNINAVNHIPRPFGLDKKTLIKLCFRSLLNTAEGFNCRIIVLGDKLSSEMISFFNKFDVELINGIYGNENSIRESIKISEQFSDNDWVYFCEDDYFHKVDAFAKIFNLIEGEQDIFPSNIKWKIRIGRKELVLLSIPRFFKKPSLAIFPCDYPDRYLPKYRLKNFIFTTSDSYWRQVSDTTFTFLMKVKDVKKHRIILKHSAYKANDRYLSNNLYGKTFFFNRLLCVSPLPSLSAHMHESVLSSFVDWKELIDELINKIE